jgi:DNA-directed RNA polymerase II subunit RPB1
MNLIFCRSSRTRNEIKQLSSPAQFFISYKDGKPKIGEAMDSIVGLAELTSSRTRMDKFHAMQLFNQVNISHDFSGYSPDKLFTGREIISIYLRESGNHINLIGTPSFYNPDHAPYRKYDADDIKVEIDRGTLKTGVLDKSTIGEGSNGGVFHIIHNQYGPQAALDASFYMQQIAIEFLYNRGFTMSLRDMLLRDEALAEIHNIEAGLIAESLQITENLNQGKIISPIGKTLKEYYEEQQINALKPGDAFWRFILESVDPDYNNMYKAIVYGARGKLFNFMNTVCAIGQLEINGERMKENFGGRTLPYFCKYDSDPRSRGYIANNYILGINPTEFFFHAMESRYALINKALSTSITGTHNRMAIKNLEPILVDNQRKAMNGKRVVQLLYGSDGADPRFIERVKFPTMRKELNWEAFEKEYRATPDMFTVSAAGEKRGGKEENKKDNKLQDMLQAEYDQLVADREFFTETFVNLEISNSRPYSDVVSMPVNPHRIIEDTLYNLELKHQKNTSAALDPVNALEQIQELCENIEYCLINSIQRKRKTRIPIHLRNSCRLLKILVRSYLNLSTLVRRGVNDQALEIIIEQIVTSYSRSLIDYGKAIGIIASQSISEPMTQMVLDSHHYSGAGSTKKKGMFRIKEILTAKPTIKMKAPSMTLQVLPEFRNNKIKVQEIANHIEMLHLHQFVNSWQVFLEKYGEPVHPAYIKEREFIKEFEKYNLHVRPPSDLTNWCVRFALDKSKLIEKQMKMDTMYHKLKENYPQTHIVYSTDNAETIVVRIYLRNAMIKKGGMDIDSATDLVQEMMNLVVRGVNGVKAAYVKEGKISEIKPDGGIVSESIYYIFTDGTNLREILEDPYIDPDTVQSDSIVETYELFGLTAARNKIISELKHQVDDSSFRHYTIYADAMTNSGSVTSIDRYGSAKRNSSILLRISDASPISVIEESAVNAFSDDLSGVSPAIIIGKNPRVGDLYNTFKMNEEMIANYLKSMSVLVEDI